MPAPAGSAKHPLPALGVCAILAGDGSHALPTLQIGGCAPIFTIFRCWTDYHL